MTPLGNGPNVLMKRTIEQLWRHRYFIRALLSTLFFLLTIAVIDFVAFFILDIKPPGYRHERFIEFDSLLGWFHKPRAEGYSYKYHDFSKWYVRINRHGFADSERKIEKERHRIALIGDSTTECWEAEQEDRPQYLLEEFSNGKYEVLNLGVRGYGTDQTFLQFKNIGVYYAPDIVIYTFCINDIWNNASSDRKPYFKLNDSAPHGLELSGYPIERNAAKDPGIIHRFTEYSLINRMTVPRISHTVERVLAKTGIIKRTQPSLESHFELRPYKAAYDTEEQKRIEVTTRIISLLNNFVEERGMKLLVVEGLYRHVLDEKRRQNIIQKYGDKFDFDKVSRILDEHTRENGIAFLSLPRRLKEEQISVADLMHPEDSTHLNVDGIHFYARTVMDKLQSLGWIAGGLPLKETKAPSGDKQSKE